MATLLVFLNTKLVMINTSFIQEVAGKSDSGPMQKVEAVTGPKPPSANLDPTGAAPQLETPAPPIFRDRVRNTEVTLECGDCLPKLKSLTPGCVDVVVTSPPYNLGINYNTFVDHLSDEQYLSWMLEWCTELRRLLKPSGSFFLNLGAAPAKPLLPYLAVAKIAGSGLFQLQNTFHWIKSISIRKDSDWVSAGHFKPLNSKRFVNDCHEFIFHLTPSGNTPLNRLAIGVPYADKSNVARWGHTEGRDKRCRGNNWFIPYRTIQSRTGHRPHPATFPTELPMNAILLHGASPDLCVLDPFNGIGHSALAAVECGVGRFYGFEMDQEYHSVTIERLHDLAKKAEANQITKQE